jgi:hypothetical protein
MSHSATSTRWPSVSLARHRVQGLVVLPAVLLAVDEEDYERLLGVRMVQHDDLFGGDLSGGFDSRI